jgi:hypothetical protein
MIGRRVVHVGHEEKAFLYVTVSIVVRFQFPGLVLILTKQRMLAGMIRSQRRALKSEKNRVKVCNLRSLDQSSRAAL